MPVKGAMTPTSRNTAPTEDRPGRSRFGPPVRTLHQSAFDAACVELMRSVEADYSPALVVGIRSGGLAVAQSMLRAASTPAPVLPLTCRRELTQVKSRLKPVRALLSALPQPAADLLRQVEHRLITAPRAHRSRPRQIDRTEADAIGAGVAMLPAPAKILVIDDAVDSGTTLATALQVLRDVCPPGTEIRSAVITQTLDHPLVHPDYVLHRGTLCRFPWSFDAAR
jgi:hypoxanthine phosphoribosyltransferase